MMVCVVFYFCRGLVGLDKSVEAPGTQVLITRQRHMNLPRRRHFAGHAARVPIASRRGGHPDLYLSLGLPFLSLAMSGVHWLPKEPEEGASSQRGTSPLVPPSSQCNGAAAGGAMLHARVDSHCALAASHLRRIPLTCRRPTTATADPPPRRVCPPRTGAQRERPHTTRKVHSSPNRMSVILRAHTRSRRPVRSEQLRELPVQALFSLDSPGCHTQ